MIHMNTGMAERGTKVDKEKKRYYARMAVLQSLISPWKKDGGKKEKKTKLLQNGVFQFCHPSKY